MTCIVGYVEGNTIWMGADSAGSSGVDIRTRVDDKIFIKNDFIFGCCGSFRMMQLLKYSLNIPSNKKKDDYEFLCTDFISSIKALFKKEGYSNIINNEESGGYFLVGYRSKLYYIESDFQVGEVIEKYNSIGSGYPYSLGALKALEGKNIPTEELIRIALDVSTHFVSTVRPPYKILTLKSS